MWRSYYISFENPISFMPYDICRQKLKRPVRFANNIWLIAYLTISIVVWTRSCIKIFWCICFAYACSKWVKAQLFFSFFCSVNCFLCLSSSPSLQSCGANESVVNVTTFNPTEEIEGKKNPTTIEPIEMALFFWFKSTWPAYWSIYFLEVPSVFNDLLFYSYFMCAFFILKKDVRYFFHYPFPSHFHLSCWLEFLITFSSEHKYFWFDYFVVCNRSNAWMLFEIVQQPAFVVSFCLLFLSKKNRDWLESKYLKLFAH